MENRENILDELTNFEKKHPKEIPQILEDYLSRIAKTGDTMFPWTKLKPLFMFKMQLVMSEFYESCPTDDIMNCPNVDRFKYDVMREKLLEAIDNFNSSAPFTIQRLCELVTAPRKHYKHTDKFMRGLEKNVLVVSTVEPGCSHIFACDCARKRSEHQTAMINGVTEVPLNGVEVHEEGRSKMHEEETKQSDNFNNPSSPNDTNTETTKDRLDDTNNDSPDTTKDSEKRIDSQEDPELKTDDDAPSEDETKAEEELRNDNDDVPDEIKEHSVKEIEKENDNFSNEPIAVEESESLGRRDSVEDSELGVSEKSSRSPDDEQGFNNNSESEITPQPSSSDTGNHELPPVSAVTTVGDEDDDDDCGAPGDNDDDDEMSVSMSLPIRDEAADIDDNTMDVPTSDVADEDCSDLLSSTSHVTSTAETLVATSDDDSRHSHERQEPMEED